ncbi:TPA: glycosyltransferase family 4 protein, partial [Escherichia coli]
MNILILSDEYYPYHIGGAGVVVSQIEKILLSKGEKYQIICSKPKNKLLCEIYKLTWPLWYFYALVLITFKRYDRIIVNDVRSAYILGLFGRIATLKKCVYLVHGTEVDIVFKSRSLKNSFILFPFFYKRFIKKIKKIVFVSKFVASRTNKELLRNNITPNKQCVCYAGLGPEIYHLAATDDLYLEDENIDQIRLVSFSRLEKRKGYMEMIEIFNALIKKGHSIHWDIYGDGSLKYDILKKIKQLELDNDIILLGKIDRNNLYKYINPNKYDAYWLLPNEPEAFGLTYIESSAMGLPVFGPKKYGIEEAIKENENGF